MKAPYLLCILTLLLFLFLVTRGDAQTATPTPDNPVVYIPTQPLTPQVVLQNPETLVTLVTKWSTVVLSLTALLATLWVNIKAEINKAQIASIGTVQQMQANSHNALTQSVTTLAQNMPPPNAGVVGAARALTILIIISLLSAGCGSTGSTPASQSASIGKAVNTSSGILTLATKVYGQYLTYQTGKKPDPMVVASQAQDDLNSIGALAQAYVGSGLTPQQANLAQGAALTSPAAQVVAALPNRPITQSTATTLFTAAAQASNP